MPLVQHTGAQGLQAVVKLTLSRRIIGPAGRDHIHWLARGGARAHQVVITGGAGQAGKVQVSDEQVLVDVARYQLLFYPRAIEIGFPAIDFGLLRRAGRGPGHAWRTLQQPLCQQRVIGVIEAGETIGHAPQGIVFGETLELIRLAALLVPVQLEIEAIRQDGNVRQRVVTLEFQHSQYRRPLRILRVQHRVEPLRTPLFSGLRVHEQSCQLGVQQAGAIVDLVLAGAPLQSLPGIQLELAGRIIAAMTNHAALLHRGFYLGGIIGIGAHQRSQQPAQQEPAAR